MVRSQALFPRQARVVLWARVVVALAFLATIPVTNPTAHAWTGTGEPTHPSSAVSITVMTANLGDGLADPAQLVSSIREHDVDLVALQEVTPGIAEVLGPELGDILPFQEVRALGIPGKALLSRFPITKVEWMEISPGRPDLLATVDIAGQPVQVVVAHPTPPELSGGLVSPREGSVEQFEHLVEVATNAEHPFLMLGDFNMIALHERHFELESIGLQDVFDLAGRGPGFTYPERVPPFPDNLVFPFLRIDYIWASGEWEALAADVGDDIGSDHRPVIALIELAEAS